MQWLPHPELALVNQSIPRSPYCFPMLWVRLLDGDEIGVDYETD
jgi:hypothetical protein